MNEPIIFVSFFFFKEEAEKNDSFLSTSAAGEIETPAAQVLIKELKLFIVVVNRMKLMKNIW